MTRTPSTRTVLKKLRDAGFPMDAIIEQGRGRIEIGYLNPETGHVDWADRQRTQLAATVASELLGWDWYGTGYGSCWLDASHRSNDATRELIRNNMD